MPFHRRDFMKLLGISVASLYLNRGCIPVTPTQTCYAPIAATFVDPPTPATASSRERLRLYWLRFGELAQRSHDDTNNKLGTELSSGHRAVLDELVIRSELTAPVADLVQEAYGAAVYHVWRSNAPITCYEPAWINYDPAGADILVGQSQMLEEIAAQGTIDPATLAKAQAALEHDLAFYALTDDEVQALYDKLGREAGSGQSLPAFEELELEVTAEAAEATRFIIELLTGK